MERWLTKKKVLFIALIGLVFSLALNYLRESGAVSYFVYKLFVEPLFFISGATLFVSFLLLPARDRVFSSWLAFAKWWIPLTILLIILSPTDGSSAFFPALFSKELTSMWMSGLFVVISLFIIAYKSFTSRKDGVEK